MRYVRTYDVLTTATRVFGVSIDDLRGESRTHPLTDFRHAVMAVLRERSRLTLVATGGVLDKDHSTVAYGCKRARVAGGPVEGYVRMLNEALDGPDREMSE